MVNEVDNTFSQIKAQLEFESKRHVTGWIVHGKVQLVPDVIITRLHLYLCIFIILSYFSGPWDGLVVSSSFSMLDVWLKCGFQIEAAEDEDG